VAANFIREKLRLMFGGCAFVLSLILHLSLVFAIGSLLPHTVGEDRIFLVSLAADFSNSTGGASSHQPEAELEPAASSAATASGDGLDSAMIKASRPALKADRNKSSPVTDHVTVPVPQTSQPESIVANTPPVALKIPTSQPIFAPAGSVSDKDTKVVVAVHAGPTSKNASEDSHPAAGAADRSFDKDYLAAVFAKIEAAKRYPHLAIRRRMEGNVEVVFRLGNDGSLLAVDLAKSSGYRSLDEAAIAAVKQAAPFPRLPESATNIPESLKITISFVLSVKD
jgi:protein TonB